MADIENYPWLGTLYYPIGRWMMGSAAVVLVTKQIVIGSADEIDRLPKVDIRARSRVVLGQKCGPGIKVREYTYHPEYRQDYSALVMIQLEVDMVKQELRPICAPPTYFIEPQIYAMTNGDCHTGKVRIYKMTYIDNEQCKQFYQNTALGFGVASPGCESPTRFLDYGMHQRWVRNSIANIGKPAITRLAQNHLILRRSLSNLQRYGRCDPEETQHEIYTDQVTIDGFVGKASYNITLYSNVEYSCIILYAKHLQPTYDETETQTESKPNPNATTTKPKRKPAFPKLYLKRWCPDPTSICYGLQYVEIHLFVQVEIIELTSFSVKVYGKGIKVISSFKVLHHNNEFAKHVSAKDISYKSLLMTLNHTKDHERRHRWFYKSDIDG